MINTPWYEDEIEQTAFNAWAFNESQNQAKLDNMAKSIVAEYNRTGNRNFNIDEDLSVEDEAYLRHKINELL